MQIEEAVAKEEKLTALYFDLTILADRAGAFNTSRAQAGVYG